LGVSVSAVDSSSFIKNTLTSKFSSLILFDVAWKVSTVEEGVGLVLLVLGEFVALIIVWVIGDCFFGMGDGVATVNL
jgi:hypothetical protein